jgi:hypothetical protein
MKKTNTKIIAVITLFLMLSFNCQAIRDADAAPNFRHTWRLDVNLSMLKDAGLLDQNNNFSFINSNLPIINEIPKNVNRIHMYGNGLLKNTSIVLWGSLTTSQIIDFITNRIKDEASQIIKSEQITSGLITINKIYISSLEKNKPREIYIAKVWNGVHVITYNHIELRRWMDFKYSSRQLRASGNDIKLFSLYVNIKPTLKNMQKENSEDVYMLKSNIFNQADKIIAEIKSKKGLIYLATLIQAQKIQDANTIKETVMSLLPSKLVEETGIQSSLINNITSSTKGKTVTISSTVPASLFKLND